MALWTLRTDEAAGGVLGLVLGHMTRRVGQQPAYDARLHAVA